MESNRTVFNGENNYKPGIFRNVFDDCINRNEHKIEVSDIKVIVSYTTQVHGNNIAFDLIAMCELHAGEL